MITTMKSFVTRDLYGVQKFRKITGKKGTLEFLIIIFFLYRGTQKFQCFGNIRGGLYTCRLVCIHNVLKKTKLHDVYPTSLLQCISFIPFYFNFGSVPALFQSLVTFSSKTKRQMYKFQKERMIDTSTKKKIVKRTSSHNSLLCTLDTV